MSSVTGKSVTEELHDRYERATRKMQAGVAHELSVSPREAAADPKHLRVGVNSAMVDASALATLLIKKGVITDLEYLEAIAEGMEAEVARYEKRLDARYGPGVVKLGGTLEDLKP